MIISMVLNHVNDIYVNNGNNDIRSIYNIDRLYWSDIRLIYIRYHYIKFIIIVVIITLL